MHDTYVFWDGLLPQQKERILSAYGAIDAWFACKRTRPSTILTVWQGDDLCGYSLMTHDRIVIQGTIVDVATIRAQKLVGTSNVTRFVELTMTHAAAALEEGIGIVLLDGQTAEWAQYGFAPISYHARTTWHVRPLSSQPQPGTVALVDADQDFTQRMTDMLRARPTGSVDILDWEEIEPSTWLSVTSRDGQLRAAALIENNADTILIRRAVASDDGAASDLVDALLAQYEATNLQVGLAPTHPLARMALYVGAQTTLHAAYPLSLLAGIIDLPTMLSALIPAFTSRVAASGYSDWVGGVRLEISDERAMIMLQAGVVRIIDGTREAAVRMRAIELPALAQLCFGYRSVGALRRAGLLSCDDTELAICEVLFPSLMPVLSLFPS